MSKTTAVLILPWRREQGVDKLSLKSQHCAASHEIKTVLSQKAVFRTALTEDVCSFQKGWQGCKLFIPPVARHYSGAFSV